MKVIKNKAKDLILLFLIIAQIIGMSGCIKKENPDHDDEEIGLSESGCDYDIVDCYYDPLHYLGIDEPDIFEISKGKYENDYFSFDLPNNYYCTEVEIGYFVYDNLESHTMNLEISYYDNCINGERFGDISELYTHIVDVEYSFDPDEDDYNYAEDIGLSVTVTKINGYDCIITTCLAPSEVLIYEKRVDFLDLTHNKIISFDMRDSSSNGKKNHRYFDDIVASIEIK